MRNRKRHPTAQPSTVRVADVLVTLTVIAVAASIALTGAAFWLSYEHLHDVADAHGLSGSRAWAWPGTVDLFIMIGEVLILIAALQHRIDWSAIGLTVAGSGGSIVINVAGVGSNARPMDYVVAAVPPIAALLAFGALMRQLHAALAARIEAPPAPLSGPSALPRLLPVPMPGALPATAAAVLPVVLPLPPPSQPEALPAPEAEAVPEPTTPKVPARPTTPKRKPGRKKSALDKDVAAALRWLAQNPGMSGAEIGRRLGKSARHGRTVLAAAKPFMADLASVTSGPGPEHQTSEE